jgi:hypothetical protein
MSKNPAPEESTGDLRPTGAPDYRARRRLDEVFGDLLPSVTGDELDPAGADTSERERWYRENRPPHHG